MNTNENDNKNVTSDSQNGNVSNTNDANQASLFETAIPNENKGVESTTKEDSQPQFDVPVTPDANMPVPTPEVEEITAPVLNKDDVTVISTYKEKKGGGFLVFIIIAAMILFVLNIDKVEEYYDKYIKQNNFTLLGKPTVSERSLVDGFIVVNDANSGDKINNIEFYNFSNEDSEKIKLNYVSREKYQNVGFLEIYIEIYDSRKDLIDKVLFNPVKVLNKNSVEFYEIPVTSYVQTNAKYFKLKQYTDEEKKSTSTLVCSLIEESNDYNYYYKNTYNFVNNELQDYSVNEEIKVIKESFETLDYKKKMEEVAKNLTEVGAVYLDGSIFYKVDFSKQYYAYNVLYEKGTTPVTIKNNEVAKKWKCE